MAVDEFEKYEKEMLTNIMRCVDDVSGISDYTLKELAIEQFGKLCC